jgi:hypothetical protein
MVETGSYKREKTVIKQKSKFPVCSFVVLALIVAILAPAAGCRHRGATPDRSEKAGLEMWKAPGYPIRLFPKNTTISMYTHNPELGPYSAKFNNEGVRDKDYPAGKPPGTVRIIVLGDSFMFGWGVEQDQTFSNQLARIYAQKKSPKVEVINLAIPGFNHISELNMLKAIGLKYHPDIVLLLANNDDIFPDNNNKIFGNMPRLTGNLAPLAEKDTSEKTKERFMMRAQTAKTAADFRKMGYDKLFNDFARKPILEMMELGKKNGFSLVLLCHVTSPLKEIYIDFANRNNIQALDLLAFIGLQSQIHHSAPLPVMAIPRDGHPTAPALNLFAQFTAAELVLPKPAR